RRGVTLYEELAGLRAVGAGGPVDYGDLAGFTPNQYWYSPGGASLANALYQLAYTHRDGNDAVGAAGAMVECVRVHERVFAEVPEHKPVLGKVMVTDLVVLRSGLPWDVARFWARRGVTLYEELAGLRAVGAGGPVDYGDLAGFTPNQYWYSPGGASLANALYQLAYTHRESHEFVTGARAMVQCVHVHERALGGDPEIKPVLGKVVVSDLVVGFRSGLPQDEACLWARRGVTLFEELAGLRAPGATDQVDYGDLAQIVPNQYWSGSGGADLTNALYQLAHTLKEANDLPAGVIAMHQRVRLFERLVDVDPSRWSSALHDARTDAAAFGS
ncbi:hypothetical protein, partial [Streptomyces sp. NPDC093225]|uniref:hypothetical protein n=1 Tax=Streptomyces sp. NPDC093225 TaxID=3366034 RepID=UPI003805FAEA